MGKDDYSLSLSLITTKNSEQKTKKSNYLRTLKSTQSRWIGNLSEKLETNHKVWGSRIFILLFLDLTWGWTKSWNFVQQVLTPKTLVETPAFQQEHWGQKDSCALEIVREIFFLFCLSFLSQLCSEDGFSFRTALAIAQVSATPQKTHLSSQRNWGKGGLLV